MKRKLHTVANHDTINFGCDYGVCFWNTLEARSVRK
jgi:hypothetical protein